MTTSGTHHDEPIENLIERSSLGSEGARQLRRRTTTEHAETIQRLVSLRNAAAHGDTEAALQLAAWLEQLGHLDEAAALYRQLAEFSLKHLSDVTDRQGDPVAAAQWRARAATLHSPDRPDQRNRMSSSAQIRQKLIDVGKKRADHEKRMADARAKQAKKNEEAASYRQRAVKTSSASLASSYLRQADSAEKAALAEGRKVADESKRAADCSSKEAALNKDLAAAVAREATTERRDRERQASAARQQHERELRAERARTAALLAASENRMTTAMSKLRTPRPEPLRILYLTASPRGDLRVDEEMRRVKAAVQAATHRDQVQIEHKPAATSSDLLDGLTRFKPHVVHFSGHANETVLVFDTGSDKRGPGQRVSAGTFARAMGAVDAPPTLVVLNACKSEAQLADLIDTVPLAIGMSDSIGDVDAMAFAARFYATLADGESAASAYRVAKAQMELSGLPDADLPILVNDPAINPAEVKLVVPPPQ